MRYWHRPARVWHVTAAATTLASASLATALSTAFSASSVSASPLTWAVATSQPTSAIASPSHSATSFNTTSKPTTARSTTTVSNNGGYGVARREQHPHVHQRRTAFGNWSGHCHATHQANERCYRHRSRINGAGGALHVFYLWWNNRQHARARHRVYGRLSQRRHLHHVLSDFGRCDGNNRRCVSTSGALQQCASAYASFTTSATTFSTAKLATEVAARRTTTATTRIPSTATVWRQCGFGQR